MSKAVIKQLDKTIKAHDTVLTDMKELKKRNEELKQLRRQLADGKEGTNVVIRRSSNADMTEPEGQIHHPVNERSKLGWLQLRLG